MEPESNSQAKQANKKKYILIISPIILILAVIIFKFCAITSKGKHNCFGVLKELLYVSIDFGNYKSNFAYSFGKNNKIIQGKMRSVPSIAILNKRTYTGKNYGTKSINSISNYDEDEMSKILYMKNLKNLLYEISNNETDIFSSNYLEASKAIIEYLKFFSDDIVKEINRLGYNKYNKNEINWIITAPKIWNDNIKLNLINFAKEAGMNNIELGLDSEVSALSIFNDKSLNDKLKTNGKIFLLIDLGDYKVDISLNEIIENNNIRQLSNPLGGYFGSMNINNDLLEAIENVFGKDVLMRAKEKQFDEYLQTLKGLEEIKKKYREKSDYLEVYAKFDRPSSFLEGWYYYLRNLFSKEKIYKEYIYRNDYGNYTIKLDDFKIYIPGNLLEDIIQRRVNEVINYTKSKIINIKKLDYILLTGGYSNSGILVNEFRKNFKNVHILSNQENSILEGSLMYLINQNRIYSTILNSTYGIGNNIYEEKIEILVKKNDIINSDFYISRLIDTKLFHNNDNICINFYKSYSDNVNKNDYFGTVTINLSEYKYIDVNKLSWKIKLRFITYFKIDIVDSITSQKIKFSFTKKEKSEEDEFN